MTTLEMHHRTGVQQPTALGLADSLLQSAVDYNFDLHLVEDYDVEIREEISHGVNDFRTLIRSKAIPHRWFRRRHLSHAATRVSDPVVRDQAVWELTTLKEEWALDCLMESTRTALSRDLTISALLAVQKLSALAPKKALCFFKELERHFDVEISEWACLLANELNACMEGDYDILKNPVSERPFVHRGSQRFDVTLPLIFQCNAYTKIGPSTFPTMISPRWFSSIFGKAMACVRQDTFCNRLVLEKCVQGLHPDGSAHYEHFPFSGSTHKVSRHLNLHNYWAQLYRPFYTSGRTEVVSDNFPVVRNVAMTFARIAYTITPERYQMPSGPLPESVRGVFFGYGHIRPKVLLKRKTKIDAGEFQLSSKVNPSTGRAANTRFYGTFFGKISDLDGDGQLDFNSIPVHCDHLGNLDYDGNGSMRPDPISPEDWKRPRIV
jgi:hypothetical protein